MLHLFTKSHLHVTFVGPGGLHLTRKDRRIPISPASLIKRDRFKRGSVVISVLFAFILLLTSSYLTAQVNMITTGSHYQDFNTLATSGTNPWTDNSTIANWYSQRTGTGTTYTADAGTGTGGTLYSYGTGTNSDRALGTIGSGNAAAGSFAHGILLRNTSGSTITDIKVTYTLEQWRNSAAAAQSITFYYKISSSPISALNPNNNATWTQVPGLTLSNPITGGTAGALDGNNALNKTTAANVSIPSLSLVNNDYIMLKWEDPDHSGTDHGISIDDVTISWTIATSPTLSVSALTDFGNVCSGATAGPNSFTITGTSLTAADITVGALAGFTYSTTAGGTYTNSLTLTQGGGAYSQAIYVKFSPSLVQSYNGNIPVGGGGATSVNCAATGSGVNTIPAITTPTSANITATTADLGGNITVTGCSNVTERGIEYSTTGGFANGTGTKVSTTTGAPFGTGAFTINVTGLTAGTVYYFHALAVNSGGTAYTAQGTFTTVKPEPTNQVSDFICGITTSSTIPLTWTAADPGSQAPDGYLILWSTGAITPPLDGTAQADGAGVKNIVYGTNNYNVGGLSSSTTYNFQIWSYTNSGTSINYNLVSAPTTSCTTLVGPCLAANFDGGTTPVGWTNNSVPFNSSGSCDATNQAVFNGAGDYLVTSVINNPSSLSFTYRRSSNTTAWSLTVQIGSSSTGPWTDIQTVSGALETCQTANIDLSAYSSLTGLYLKFIDARSSGANERYIDNVEVNCSSVCLAPTTQAHDITFGGITSNSMTVNWTNGNGSKRVVIMNTSNSFTSPVDGTDPTANSVYGGSGEQVVYNNNGSGVTVSGLTASTTYWFRVYEYNCSGVNTKFITSTATLNPNSQATNATGSGTVLNYGDLAILAVNANLAHTSCAGGYPANNNGDEISFVCFKEITNGTVIEVTDNGYERNFAGLWGNNEGGAKLVRNGSTIPAGTVITFRTDMGTAPTHNIIFVSPDANWVVSDLDLTGAPSSKFNLNSGGDQVYFANGESVWTNNTTNGHNADYPGPAGKILFGFTTNGQWNSLGLSSQQSGLYPGISCFSTLIATGYTDYNKYTGPLTNATQRDWIDRINNSANWTAYATCALYQSSGPNYVGGYTIGIIDGGFTAGKWTGILDNDWFKCDNWENMYVPDTSTNVSIPTSGVTFEPTIGSGNAYCSDISIENPRILTINNASSVLNVYGSFTNNGTLTHSAGSVAFRGGLHKTIGGTNAISFYNLNLNKKSNNYTVTLNKNILVKNTFSMNAGLLVTGSYYIEIGYDVSNRGSLSYVGGIVVGKVKRWYTTGINSAAEGLFPLGTAGYYRPATIEFNPAPTTGGSLTAQFITTIPADYYDGLPLTDAGQVIDNLANEGFWQIDAADGLNGGTYTITLQGDGFSAANDPTKVRIVKRPSTGGNWLASGSHGVGSGPPLKVTRLGLTGFSQFALGGLFAENPLPVQLIAFSAKYNGTGVNINWSTASESNNDFFTIERSSDATTFNSITSVKGSGNSNQLLNYSVTDSYPLKGLNYYRLKQTDFNSKSVYSKIISVNTSENNCTMEITQLFIQGNILNIKLNCIHSKLRIDLIDITGRIVYSEIDNPADSSQNIKVPLPALMKGIYFIKVISDNDFVVKKFSL